MDATILRPTRKGGLLRRGHVTAIWYNLQRNPGAAQSSSSLNEILVQHNQVQVESNSRLVSCTQFSSYASSFLVIAEGLHILRPTRKGGRPHRGSHLTAMVEVGDPTKTQQLGELTHVSKSWMPALSSLAKGLGHTAGALQSRTWPYLVFRGAFWTWPVFSQDWRPESGVYLLLCTCWTRFHHRFHLVWGSVEHTISGV